MKKLPTDRASVELLSFQVAIDDYILYLTKSGKSHDQINGILDEEISRAKDEVNDGDYDYEK